ncbi:MAG: hypothetical protein LUC97_01960, partial [Clostridiales bacterium]|nr:hypothetical protein [Clostridiales bacterium]
YFIIIYDSVFVYFFSIAPSFDKCIEESLASDVENGKYNNILYTDIRFTVGNTVCFEFTAEEDSPLELPIKISDVNPLNDIKGHWNISVIEYINSWNFVTLDDLGD